MLYFERKVPLRPNAEVIVRVACDAQLAIRLLCRRPPNSRITAALRAERVLRQKKSNIHEYLFAINYLIHQYEKFNFKFSDGILTTLNFHYAILIYTVYEV